MRLLDSAVEWLQDWGARRARRQLFVEHGRSALELSARGLAPDALLAIAAKAPRSADLLRLRLAALGIDADLIARTRPDLLRDMQARCRICDSRAACAWDLAQDPARGAWQTYCENALRIKALAA